MQFKELTLLTTNLEGQQAFYTKTLDCPLIAKTPTSFTIQIGGTSLQFKQSTNAYPYHFAINVPAFQENETLEWLQKKVAILPFQGKEIVDFSNWNARAIYFYDPDKNIVELIARRNLKRQAPLPFSAKSFLEISEIGMPVTNVEAAFNQLQTHLGVTVFDGSFDKFCAVGEEQGLFIIIDKAKKDWFPLNDKAFSADFDLVVHGVLGKKIICFKGGLLKFN